MLEPNINLHVLILISKATWPKRLEWLSMHGHLVSTCAVCSSSITVVLSMSWSDLWGPICKVGFSALGVWWKFLCLSVIFLHILTLLKKHTRNGVRAQSVKYSMHKQNDLSYSHDENSHDGRCHDGGCLLSQRRRARHRAIALGSLASQSKWIGEPQANERTNLKN